MALVYNATFDKNTRKLSFEDKAGNVISSCEVPSKELVDDPSKPLMLRAIEDNSSVTLTKKGTLSNTYQTSTNGEEWTDYTLGTEIRLNKGESVYFRCSSHPTTQSISYYVYFNMTGKIEAWHNAYSMISSYFSYAEGSVGNYGMVRLFGDCASLTKAPLLVNALSPSCYRNMFSGCSALTQAPKLPATTLAQYCYSSMFLKCSALTQAPELPATTLAQYCYQSMFQECSALTQAPELPATTLAEHCYSSMFLKCSALTQAPELPATTLEVHCYYSMFLKCSALTQAPLLPATTLSPYCYYNMFFECSKLKEVRVSATKKASDALGYWLSGVSATGDFYCDPNATIFPTGESGCPSGWRRLNINDYPN